jgi:cephalosporin hydroxylase
MKLLIDTVSKKMTREENKKSVTLDLFSKEAYELITEQWLKIGWNENYSYTFTWMGMPIIQLPEDMVRIQEVIFQVQPEVIIETGIAHGGSLIYYASLARAMGKGRVIGIDIDIKPQNRKTIESHPLAGYITLIEGSSTDSGVISQVKSLLAPGETVLVILDSNHSKRHVQDELDAYHQFVTPGSFIIATDGIMKDLYDTPHGKKEWEHDNPYEAAKAFVESHREFAIARPAWLFNESQLSKDITYWPGAWLRRT